eukprot:Pgem_evm1s12340
MIDKLHGKRDCVPGNAEQLLHYYLNQEKIRIKKIPIFEVIVRPKVGAECWRRGDR